MWSEERTKNESAPEGLTAEGTPSEGAPPGPVSSERGAPPPMLPPSGRGSDELPPGTARLYLNLGRKDGASEHDVLDLLKAHSGLASPPEIDIMNTHTYINVPADDAPKVCEALTGKELAGRSLVCEPAKPRRR